MADSIAPWINYNRLPEHMQDGTRLYIEHGIQPGRFLTAVLTNDLMGAVGRADEMNAAAIWDWCSWLYNEAPAGSWGSLDKFEAWIAKGGLSAAEAA